MIRLKAVTLSAVAMLMSLPVQANDGAPPYTFEGTPGPVLELNDQGKPTFQAAPETEKPAAPAPRPVTAPRPSSAAPSPAAAPARVAAPAAVAAPAPVAAPVASPAPVTSQPPIPGAVLQPVQGRQVVEPSPVVTPVTTAPLQWENPPQGDPPFVDPQPAPPIGDPEAAKSCTREAFNRGMCIAR